jgi:Zn-dependent protease with chaperone function
MNNVFFSAHEDLKPTGGACAGLFEAGAEKHLLDCKHDQARFARLNQNNKPVILVYLPIVGKLTGAELAAVIAHEQGHIDCGHIAAAKEAAASGCVGVIDPLKLEFEADAYAAAKCGAATMLSALQAITNSLRDEIKELAGGDEGALARVDRIIQKSMGPRLNALRAML